MLAFPFPLATWRFASNARKNLCIFFLKGKYVCSCCKTAFFYDVVKRSGLSAGCASRLACCSLSLHRLLMILAEQRDGTISLSILVCNYDFSFNCRMASLLWSRSRLVEIREPQAVLETAGAVEARRALMNSCPWSSG